MFGKPTTMIRTILRILNGFRRNEKVKLQRFTDQFQAKVAFEPLAADKAIQRPPAKHQALTYPD